MSDTTTTQARRPAAAERARIAADYLKGAIDDMESASDYLRAPGPDADVRDVLDELVVRAKQARKTLSDRVAAHDSTGTKP